MLPRLRITLVILAAAAVYLLGNDRVPLWDRDEPRNAQAARQMYQSGDWVVPRFLDQVRTAKPVFTYWCQTTAMHIFGENTFAARFPSALGMTLTLIVLAVVLARYVDPDRAFWTVFILATSAIVIAWSAKTSLTDAVLLLWIVIAQLCLYAILNARAIWPVVITMSIAIGLAGLTKGPVVLGVMGMTFAALLVMNWKRFVLPSPARGFEVIMQTSGTGASPVQRDHPELHGRGARATFKTFAALAIIAAIVGPWLYLVEHRAPGFILTTASHDVVRRIFEPLEQHKGPPGYYLLMLWGIYFPWSVLLPLTFVVAWRHRDDPRIRFALAATIGPWLMLECVQTKLPHYLLPIFPPLAFLTADAIVRCLKGEHDDLITRGTRGAIVVWSLIVVVIAIAFDSVLHTGKYYPGEPPNPLWGFTFLVAMLPSAFFLYRKPKLGLICMGAGTMAIMAILFGWYLPRLPQLRLSIQIAAILKQNGGAADSTHPGDVQMIQYKEPSLAFYQGGTIREQSENDFLLTHPSADWPRYLVIRQDIWDRTPDPIKQQLQVLGEATGLDLADAGRTWTVIVAKKR